MVNETIDISSTITTSWGNWLFASWRNRARDPGSQPSSRCSVDAETSPIRSQSSADSFEASPRTASASRAAALPVGAASAIRGGGPG